jgi:hypothetical protein
VEDLEALLADGRSPVVAAAASVLAPAPPREGKPDPRGHTWRSVDRRWIRLTLWPSPAEPSSPAAAAVQIAERSWPADAQWLVLRQRAQAGQTVAGMADAASAVGRQLDARAGPVDRYYAQADQVLQALGRHLAPAGSRLRLGEDLSLHDALACASPAWSNWKIPAEATQQACVQHHGWLHRQIAHSRPRVLLVTSSTALRLMASDRHGRFSPPLPLPGASVWSEIGGADDLRRWVADHGLTWTPQGQAPIPVVLAGHLSYADSLAPQCHVPVRQWDAFCALFPDAVQVLVNAGLVDGRTIAAGSAGAPAPAAPAAPAAARPQVIRLSARGADRHAPVWQALAGCRRSGTLPPDLATVLLPGASAADALEPWWHDPQQELIARLLTAVRAQKVAWDPQRQALAREVGDCRYCDNDWWQIDGGCRYAGAVPPGPPSPSNPPDLPSPPDPLTAQQETRP